MLQILSSLWSNVISWLPRKGTHANTSENTSVFTYPNDFDTVVIKITRSRSSGKQSKQKNLP